MVSNVNLVLGTAIILGLIQQNVFGQPLDESNALESKIRDERKVSPQVVTTELKVSELPTLPHFPTEEQSQTVAVAPPEPNLDPVQTDVAGEDDAKRFKKHACPTNMPCASFQPSARSSSDEHVILLSSPAQERTIQPHVVSISSIPIVGGGASGGGGLSSNYQPLYGYEPVRGLQHFPSGFQFNAIHQHQLMSQDRPEVVYYNIPEPIYVAGDSWAPQLDGHKCSLKCSGSGKKIGKTLEIAEEQNATDADQAAHIKRVNDIQQEISELNMAAKRIVDLQEQNARMHNDHMNMLAAAKAASTPSFYNNLPQFLRHQQLPMSPYGMYGPGFHVPYMRPPIFKNAEEAPAPPSPKNEATPDPSSVPQKSEPEPEVVPPAIPQTPQSDYMRQYPSYGGYYGYRSQEPHASPPSLYRAPDDYMRQGFYPSYGGYYGYRSQQPMYYPPVLPGVTPPPDVQVINEKSSGDEENAPKQK